MFKDYEAEEHEKKMKEIRLKLHEAHLRSQTPFRRRMSLNADLAAVNANIEEMQKDFQPGQMSREQEEGLTKAMLEREQIRADIQGLNHKHPMAHDALAGIGGFTEQAGFGSARLDGLPGENRAEQ
jgi:hypothetical protein